MAVAAACRIKPGKSLSRSTPGGQSYGPVLGCDKYFQRTHFADQDFIGDAIAIIVCTWPEYFYRLHAKVEHHGTLVKLS